jgi:hypothetical protein
VLVHFARLVTAGCDDHLQRSGSDERYFTIVNLSWLGVERCPAAEFAMITSV